MPDPFVCCGRIKDPNKFVGREKELQAIFTALETAHTGQAQSISVVGPRRMGRSSLLTHISQVYPARLQRPEQYVIRYVTLHSQSVTADLPTLLKALLETLRAGLPAAAGSETAQLREEMRQWATQGPATLPRFEKAIQAWRELSTPMYPILCLDELEHLTQDKERFPNDLYDSWRGLMADGYLGLVITTSRPLYELAQIGRLTSPFFNIFGNYLTLGELTETEARNLINWGRGCDRPFDDDDCERALKWAGRHPLKLQQAGKAIYNAKDPRRPAPNWRVEQQQYQAMLRQQFGRPTRRQRLREGVCTLAEGVGRLASFWKAAPLNPTEARLVGGVLLLLGLALLALLIFSPFMRQWVGEWLRWPTPTPTIP